MKNLRNRLIFKIILFAAVFGIGLNLSGCDPLKRKFTRKKKTPVKQPRFYQVKEYEKKPAPELYVKRYSYWASWQSELVKVIGKNSKKDMRCINEILGNLRDMQNLLVKTKADELEIHIQKYVKIRDIIANGELDVVNRDYVRRLLEREGGQVRRSFAYNKVKDAIEESSGDDSE